MGVAWLAAGFDPAQAGQPDLLATEQRLEWVQRPQRQGDWGRPLSAGGDINGDGFGDLAVAVPTLGANAPSGRLYLYFGSSAGVVQASEQVIVADCRDFGEAVGAARDVNRDGYADIIVGGTNEFDCMASVWVYLGAAAGLDPASALQITPSGLEITDTGPTEYDGFGSAVDGAGDVNADGYDDVVIGRPRAPGGGPTDGAVYVYLGSAAGIDLESEQRIAAPPGRERFGARVVGLGDLNGDGYADLGVGLEDGGAVFLYYGSPNGPREDSMQTLLPPPGAEALFANDRQRGFGLSAAGDIDADGFDDLAAYAPAFPRTHLDTGTDTADPPANGAVLVYYGSPAGVEPLPGRVVEPTDPMDIQMSISSTGDVDGDGHDELLIGVYTRQNYWLRGAYVHYGGPRGLPLLRSERLRDPNGAVENDYGDVTGGGVDLDGDGSDDVIVGGGDAYYEPKDAIFLYYGSVATPGSDTADTGDTGNTARDTGPDSGDRQTGDTGGDTAQAHTPPKPKHRGCGGCGAVHHDGSGSLAYLIMVLAVCLRRRSSR